MGQNITPMRTIHPLLLTKTIPFTYS